MIFFRFLLLLVFNIQKRAVTQHLWFLSSNHKVWSWSSFLYSQKYPDPISSAFSENLHFHLISTLLTTIPLCSMETNQTNVSSVRVPLCLVQLCPPSQRRLSNYITFWRGKGPDPLGTAKGKDASSKESILKVSSTSTFLWIRGSFFYSLLFHHNSPLLSLQERT